MKHPSFLKAALCASLFFLLLFAWIATMTLGQSTEVATSNLGGGKSIIILIPAYIIGLPWLYFFGDNGYISFGFWVISALILVLSLRIFKTLRNYIDPTNSDEDGKQLLQSQNVMSNIIGYVYIVALIFLLIGWLSS